MEINEINWYSSQVNVSNQADNATRPRLVKMGDVVFLTGGELSLASYHQHNFYIGEIPDPVVPPASVTVETFGRFGQIHGSLRFDPNGKVAYFHNSDTARRAAEIVVVSSAVWLIS